MPRSSGRIAVQKPEQIHMLSTLSTVQFTGALAMYAHETASLSGLLANKISLKGVNGQSVQNLKYKLWVWGDGNYDSAQIDSNSYITDIILDFSDTLTAGRIASAGTYKLDIDKLERSITTVNKTLYMSLQNLSPISKIAGASGAVQLDLKYALRL